MSDIVEGMARAMWDAGVAPLENGDQARALAQAALDYLKQPKRSALDVQGPELTIEQIKAMEKLP